MTAPSTIPQNDLKARNTRLALILASIAATFFIGFMAKMTLLAHH